MKQLATGLLVASAWLCGSCAEDGHRTESNRPKSPPDVFLIIVDTLRADHLGTYGYDRNTSPNLDRFASRATVFEMAITQAPHTIPSVLQIMTSRYRQGGTVSPETPTMAELLRKGGYRTAAVVENANFEFTRDGRGLLRGFDTFYRNGLVDPDEVFQQHWKSKTPADAITAQARRWLDRFGDVAPFFLWLHYFDPHDPYAPPYSDDMEVLTWNEAPTTTGDIRATSLFPGQGVEAEEISEADRRKLVALYDAEIRYLDQSLGELFHSLEERNLMDGSLIIVTADHGESFGENGEWTHGTSLFDEQIHVPLIIKYPGQTEGERIREPVETLDILPTVLDLVGIESEVRFDGRSLTHELRGTAFTFWKDEWAVRTRDWKLLERAGHTYLYRVQGSVNETRDLSSQRPDVLSRLRQLQEVRLVEIDASSETLEQSSEEAVRQMKVLGYLD